MQADDWDSKAYSEYFDPCQEAADKSLRCLKRNGGERAMCSDFFQSVDQELR
jgi:cytochrome c oxidase assembly protein subunit 23